MCLACKHRTYDMWTLLPLLFPTNPERAREASLQDFFEQAFSAEPIYGLDLLGSQAQELAKTMTFAGRRSLDPLLQHLRDYKAGRMSWSQ